MKRIIGVASAIGVLVAGILAPAQTAAAAPLARVSVTQTMSIGTPNGGSAAAVDLGDQFVITNVVKNTGATAVTIPGTSLSFEVNGRNRQTSPEIMTLAPGESGTFTTTMIAADNVLNSGTIYTTTLVKGTPSECATAPCAEVTLGRSVGSSLTGTRTQITLGAQLPGQGAWTSGPALKDAVDNPGGAYDPKNRRLWVAGGGRADGTASDVVSYLDLTSISAGWQDSTPLPAGRQSQSVIYDEANNYLWVIGGGAAESGNPESQTRTSLYLDLSDTTSGWQVGPQLLAGVEFSGGTYDPFNERIWMAAGLADVDSAMMQYLDVRNIAAGWQQGPDMPRPIRKTALAYDPVSHRIWSVGGTNAADRSGWVFAYLRAGDLESGWTDLTRYPGSYTSVLAAPSAAFVPTLGHIALSFSISPQQWANVAWQLHTPYPGFAGSIFPQHINRMNYYSITADHTNGYIWALGGRTYAPGGSARIVRTSATEYLPLGGWIDKDGDGRYSAGDEITLRVTVNRYGDPRLTHETPVNTQGKLSFQDSKKVVSTRSVTWISEPYIITSEDTLTGSLRFDLTAAARLATEPEGAPTVTTSNYISFNVAPYYARHLVHGSTMSVVNDGKDPGAVNAGESVRHEIRIQNTGNDAWTELVVESSDGRYECPQSVLPTRIVTCTRTWEPSISQLKSGRVDSGTFTISYQPRYGPRITSGENESVWISAVVPETKLSLSINAEDSNTGAPVLNGAVSVPPGTPVRFQYVVSNDGDLPVTIPADGITTGDGIQVTCTPVVLRPGQQTTCQSTTGKVIQ